MKDNDLTMSRKEVAELFNVYPQAVYSWTKKGWLVEKLTEKGKRYYLRKDVEKFYQVSKVGTVCKDCNEDNPKSGFKIPKNIIEYGVRCLDCHRLRDNRWGRISRNRRTKEQIEKELKITSEHRKNTVLRNQKFICDYLIKHPCVDCKESNIIVLEFDHVKGEKFKNISHLVASAAQIQKIEAEINKCEVVCANCHRIRTNKRSNHYRYRYLYDHTNDIL